MYNLTIGTGRTHQLLLKRRGAHFLGLDLLLHGSTGADGTAGIGANET